MKLYERCFILPIIAHVRAEKITQVIVDVLDSIRKNRKIKMSSVKINGYFLYRYRGILLVRKGFSDALIIHDYNAVKKYLIHVINSVLRSDYILWAKTSGLVEIVIEAEKKDKTGIIFIEASNDKLNENGNFRMRVITHRKITDRKLEKPIESNIETKDNIGELINSFDEIIINEDLKRLTPIDIYDFFDADEVENIINVISKNSETVSVADTVESK